MPCCLGTIDAKELNVAMRYEIHVKCTKKF